jgi:hypothetical protein
MLNENGFENTEDTSVPKKTVRTNTVQGSGSAPKSPDDEKSWGEWIKPLGVSRAIARGACAEVKGDWDSPVSKSVFESSVKSFSEKGHGR